MRKPKIKVIPLDEKHQKLAKILEEYYAIAHRELIEAIRFEIFNPDRDLRRRKKAYRDYGEVVFKLQPIFKKLATERNRLANEDGYKNYFDFITTSDGIPKDKLELFFTKADELIKEINQKLPLPPKNCKWYWSEFNIPDFLSLVSAPKFSLPKDIFKIARKINPKFKEVIPKIKLIGKIKDFHPTTRYDKKNGTITIEALLKPNIYNALTLVHELGHALSFWECLEKGVDLSTKSRYWKEKEAFRTLFEFEEFALPREVKNASQGQILGDFLTAFFEYEIYTNPNQDFDKLYAQAHNRCHPQSKQRKNPFYVLENNLVLSPCSVVTTSVAETELLLKN
ncbi:MAG: hypothetical protein ACOZBZ_03025 [Patescibacteria group bacterium]